MFTRTLTYMNKLATPPTFLDAPAFQVREHTRGGRVRSLFTRADTEAAEIALLERLERAAPGTLLVVDFSTVRISSEAARQLLRRALLRIAGGEFADRYLVLGDLGESRYNVEVMLVGESLIAVERSEDEGPKPRGAVDPAIRVTYEYVVSKPTATASMVLNDLGLTAIAAATNRLSNLARLGLARRVEQRPVQGGGREYVYAAVR
jgi:hypothetical protein